VLSCAETSLIGGTVGPPPFAWEAKLLVRLIIENRDV